MIIARDVKIVPRAAGEWDNTSSAITLFAGVVYCYDLNRRTLVNVRDFSRMF
jgi:hypothetical protein